MESFRSRRARAALGEFPSSRIHSAIGPASPLFGSRTPCRYDRRQHGRDVGHPERPRSARTGDRSGMGAADGRPLRRHHSTDRFGDCRSCAAALIVRQSNVKQKPPAPVSSRSASWQPYSPPPASPWWKSPATAANAEDGCRSHGCWPSMAPSCRARNCAGSSPPTARA